MILVIRFVVCHLIGLIGHQTSHIVDKIQYPDDYQPPMGNAWYMVLRYTIGGVMLGLGLLVMLGGRRDLESIVTSYFTGAVGVGSGVALGYWLDER